ncbi:urease accessory protein UreD [Planktotalea sp.]|uniref:urease accessory protein UreD n=1 Tax=Planktotalea sp. TaxID=2029877 RepID=UPI0025CE53DA|nr:urease accessory protein UreD [Planktotalea sp.]
MNTQLPIDSATKLQRARGKLSISAQRASGDVTRLKNLRQQGSYRAIFPRPIAGNIEAVIINTAGGVTGGDKFFTSITALETAQVNVTTQAAERIYRATGSATGIMRTKLYAENAAQLYWLPQETILFDGARLQRSLDIDVHPNAKFLMVEPLVFGREASGETLRSGVLDDRVTITSNGQPIYHDRIKLEGDIAAHLKRPAIANSARAAASIVLVDQHAKPVLAALRNLLPTTAGASLLSETILVVRVLATDSYALRSALFPILTLLTNNAVPKNWRL